MTPTLDRPTRGRLEEYLGPHRTADPLPDPFPIRTRPRAALLVYPPTGLFDRADRCQTPLEYTFLQGARPPLDLALIAGALEGQAVRCVILDLPAMGKGWACLVDAIRRERPDLLVVTTTAFTLAADLFACRLARSWEPGCRTVLRGNLLGSDPQHLLASTPPLDAVLGAEDETLVASLVLGGDPLTVPGCALRRDGQPAACLPRVFGPDLDHLPVASRGLLRNHLYRRPDTGRPMTTVLAQRGCPHHCTFCLAPVVSGSRSRVRSPEKLAGEISHCIRHDRIQDFHLKADSFNLDRRWALDVCDLLRSIEPRPRWVTSARFDAFDDELAGRMRQAGCWLVAFGLESASPTIQEEIRKPFSIDCVRRALGAAHSAGLKSLVYLTIGFPSETRETVEETLAAVQSLPWDLIEVHLAVAFPGTPLHQQARALGLLDDGGATTPLGPYLLRSVALSRRELGWLRLNALGRLYSRLATIPLFLGLVRSGGGPVAALRLAGAGLSKLPANLLALRRASREGA